MTTIGDDDRSPTVRETVSDEAETPEAEAPEAATREPEVVAPHEEPKGWGIGAVTVVSLAAAFVVVWGISQHASMVMPAFLALNLVIAAQPLQKRLEKVGLPRWGGMIVVLLVLYMVLAALVGMLVWAVWVAAEEIPQYQDKFTELYEQSIAFLGTFGVSEGQISSGLSGIDPQAIMGTLQNVAGQVSSAGGMLSVLVIALTFLVFDVPASHVVARSSPSSGPVSRTRSARLPAASSRTGSSRPCSA